MTLALWTARQCADALGISYRQFTNRICHVDGFPKPVDDAALRMWKAAEVMDWATAKPRQSAGELEPA